jgi:hypothetical protein
VVHQVELLLAVCFACLVDLSPGRLEPAPRRVGFPFAQADGFGQLLQLGKFRLVVGDWWRLGSA